MRGLATGAERRARGLGLRAGMLAGPPSTRAVRLLPGYQRAMAAAALVLIVALAIFAVVAVRRRRSDRAFLGAAVPAEAEVTDVRWKTVGPLPERDRLAYPLLRFALPDGSLIEARSQVSAPAAEVGDRVSVLYLPDDPSRVRVDSHASPSSGSTSGT